MAKNVHVTAGTLLAAWPDLLDPNFMHSVVLICEHSDEGAYGLVTNRVSQFCVCDLLPEHPSLGNSSFPVHVGGPVDHQTLQFLHRVPESIPGGLCLDGSLWLGGELDALGRYLHEAEDPESSLRIFLGYSGWGAGQLDAELQIGSWLPAQPLKEAIFGPPGEGTWKRVVRSVGKEARDLGDLPPDVSWN